MKQCEANFERQTQVPEENVTIVKTYVAHKMTVAQVRVVVNLRAAADAATLRASSRSAACAVTRRGAAT